MATAILAALAVASIVFWYEFPLERYLPEAIVTAKQVDTLFRFMAATGSALYIFVAGYLVYFSIAFRARATDPPDAIGVTDPRQPQARVLVDPHSGCSSSSCFRS